MKKNAQNVVSLHCDYLETVCFLIFTAQCTLVQSAILQSHVVRLSARPSVCDVGDL